MSECKHNRIPCVYCERDAATARVRELEAENSSLRTQRDWLVADSKTWSCPECAFTFAAHHANSDGSMSCPVCSEHRLIAYLNLARQELAEMRAERDALRKALQSARTVMATSARDWSTSGDLAWLWGMVWGWGPLDDVRDADAMPEVAAKHHWSTEVQERLNGFARAIDHTLTRATEDK